MNKRVLFTKLPGAAFLLALAMTLIFDKSASANLGEGLCEPCFSVPYFTVDQNAAREVRSDNFRALVTVGEVELTATVTNFEEHSAALGFWSFYLTEPQSPVVTATDGDHQDRVEVSWELVDDRVGPPVTEDKVLLYRNGTILTTLPLIQTEYQDFNVFPGEEYEYSVVPGNSLGRSHFDDEVGFLNPNGVIAGKVETPNGNPVNEVKVVLTPNLGRSGSLQDDAYVFFPDRFTGLEQSYSIEGWFRSIALQEQTLFAAVDSATTRPFARIQLTETGALRWEHRGGTAAEGDESDIVTTPISYTLDSQWHHFAAVLADSNMSMTLYVDGRIAARSTAVDTIGTQSTQVVLGKKGSIEHEQYYQGRLDDWRVWSLPKTRAEIRRDMDRTLEGDEGGLAAYWKFDEVKGEKLFDLTANDQDGIVCKIERSDYKAPVFVSGVTDTLGHYSIKGIYYGAGTTFTATPQKTTPIGTSLDFDGVDDYLDFSQDLLDFTGGYTIEGWFKNPDGSGDMTIFAAENPVDNGNHVRIDLLDDGRLQLTHQNVSVATTELYDNEFWYHFAATHDIGDGSLTFYINGEVVGSGTGGAITESSAFIIGRQAPSADGQYYRGWLDEIRVWDRGRNLEQINAVKNQVLAGTETGMIAYWHFNEGDGALALDATENSHIGDLVGEVKWVDDIPLNEVFTNTFDPESRQVILNPSNTSVDHVDFTDISQIAVTGFVKYSGTACFIERAEILVNGESLLPPRFTDENGRYVVEFEPGSRRQQISVKYKDHDMLPPFIELPTITRPIAGLFFEDTVKREVSGIVAGGVCKLPITPIQGQIEVEVTTIDGCFSASVVPDPETGLFVIRDIPPVIYNLTISHPNPEIDAFFTADTLSAEEENRQVEFVYRAPPEVAISGFPLNGCGLRVMEMAEVYDLDISIFESYTSQGVTATCVADSGGLTIFDDIGDRGTVEQSFENGQATYRIGVGKPNILDGGDHPYQKPIQVTASVPIEGSGPRTATLEEWSYVTGNREREVNFATQTPQLPFMILRKPPGDQSFSFVEQGKSLEMTATMAINRGATVDVWATIHMGPDITTEAGSPFFSKDTEIDYTLDATGELGFAISQSVTQEQTWSFSATETISTAGESDVYVCGAINILYGITDVLSIDETTCETSIDADIIIVPEGIATTFIYSEGFILDEVIPELELLGDQASADVWMSFIAWNEKLKKESIFAAGLPRDLMDQAREAAAALGIPAAPTSLIELAMGLLDPLGPAVTSRNISFDAGSQFDFEETTELSSSLEIAFDIEIEAAVALEAGVTVDGVGATGGARVGAQLGIGNAVASTITHTNTVGFTLADDDDGDNFSINVRKDFVYGTPTFELVSGVSSCPYEEGTVPVDGPQLTVSPAQQVDVSPLEAAVYTLNIGNVSQTEADREYALKVLNETNPGGAQVAVNAWCSKRI